LVQNVNVAMILNRMREDSTIGLAQRLNNLS